MVPLAHLSASGIICLVLLVVLLITLATHDQDYW